MIRLENIIFENVLQKTCYFKEIGILTDMNYNKNRGEKKQVFNYNKKRKIEKKSYKHTKTPVKISFKISIQ